MDENFEWENYHITREDEEKFLGPNDQPPCGQCDFVKFILKGNNTGQYICRYCGYRITEEEYKQWKKGEF